jgi:hypothetical protein
VNETEAVVTPPTAEPAQPAQPVQETSPEERVEALYGAEAPEPEPQPKPDAPRGLPTPAEEVEIDPEEAAYVDAQHTIQLGTLVEKGGARLVGEIMQLATQFGYAEQEVGRAIQAGQVNEVLAVLERQGIAAAEQLAQTDKGRAAAARVDLSKHFAELRKRLDAVRKGGAHVQQREAERIRRQTERKRERELAKLPKGFDVGANLAWMRAQGYSDADIASVDTAKKALAIDAMRRGSTTASNTAPRVVKVPRFLKRPKPAAQKRPETFNEFRARVTGYDPVVTMYGKHNRTSTPTRMPRTSAADAIAILYGEPK